MERTEYSQKLISMRFIFIFILFSNFNLFAQNAIGWENEIQVANGATYGNIRPRIVLTADEIPVVVFGRSANGKIYSARWNGSSFDEPIDLLPVEMTAYLASWTSADAAAKGDTIVVTFKENPMETGNVYTVRSVDGGLTYAAPVRVDVQDNSVAWLPSLDIDQNGNPTVVYMAHDPIWVHPRYVVAKSTDQGQSYFEPMDVAISIPDEACDCCPAEYVIEGSREVLLFRNNASNVRDIYGVYSADSGETFPHVENVDQLNWVVNSCPSTGPHALFTEEDLLSVYASRASGQYRVYLSRSTAGTDLEFIERIQVIGPENASGIQNYPRITGKEDTVIVAWQESDPSNPEIFCGFTFNGDLSEISSTKHIVNLVTQGPQTNPDLIYKNGFIHLVYQDGNSGSVIYRRGKPSALSLAEINIPSIDLYPNPVIDGKVTLVSNFPLNTEKIRIFDLKGNVLQVKVTSIDNFKCQIELKEIQSGTVIIEYADQAGNFNKELFILNH